MEASDLVYYTLYDVTEELMVSFINLMHELGMIDIIENGEVQ
jgi:hypothetical protein